MITLRVAWRNIWRSKRRTAITATAVALNTAILIVSYGLMNGMMVDTVKNITDLVIGDAQIHAPGYRADNSFYKDIKNPEKILAAAERAGIRAAPRSYSFGLVSSGNKSAGGKYWGIVPERDQQAFDLGKQVDQGKFLAADRAEDGSPKQVVLGRKLAKSLHARVGSEIIAVVQAGDGSLGNELYTVRGILKTCGEEIDRSAVIMHQDDFEELFVSGGRIHQIGLNARGKLTPEEVVAAMQPAAGEMELKSWSQLMPIFADMVKGFEAGIWIFGAIFFLAAGLGVLNTMLQATYERIREFGMLKAMGATPWRIIRDVSAEAFMLALFATAVGFGIGLAANIYFHVWGLDLSGVGGDLVFSGIAFNPLWRATMTGSGLVSPVIIMWIVCVLAALWPAVKAARLDPVRAITHV